MSIMYCEKHNRHWDSDKVEVCPGCETEFDDDQGESVKCYDCPIHGLQDGEECPEC